MLIDLRSSEESFYENRSDSHLTPVVSLDKTRRALASGSLAVKNGEHSNPAGEDADRLPEGSSMECGVGTPSFPAMPFAGPA